MTTNPSAENQPQPHGQTASDFAALMHAFWDKNRMLVLGLCVAVLLLLMGREGWELIQAKHEQGIREEYVATADEPAKLAVFAAAHEGHPLGGAAWLRMADKQYAAGDFKSAVTSYAKAAASMTEPVFKSRARLGAAMSQLAGGDTAAGEAALKELGADAAVEKVVRAEATYHLASLAQQAGKIEEARRLAGEVGKIDATGLWAQHAFVLLAALNSGEQKPAEAQNPLAPEFKLKP